MTDGGGGPRRRWLDSPAGDSGHVL